MKAHQLPRTALLIAAFCTVLATVPAAAAPLPKTNAQVRQPVYCDALYVSCSRGGPALPTQ